MSNIDWSKAPEGTTGAMVANFFEKDEGIYPGYIEFIGFDGADDRDVYDEGPDAWIFCERPKSWTGEGLPPVGMPCEYYWASDDSWRDGTCVAHFDGRVVICDRDDEDCAERLDAHHVRPIRTPEQIAADERLHKIRNAHTAIARTLDQLKGDIPGGAVARTVIEAMIDAGYRKVEGGEK